jgi:hypothetical protein
VQEEDDEEPQQQLNNPAPQDTTEMQPLQPQNPPEKEKGGASDILAQDGLKLMSELNLDIEIELKASIHGDGKATYCADAACSMI